MLKDHFKNAVLWCFSPQKGFESGRKLGERLFGNWIAASENREKQDQREQLIHRQAARAVEWQWGRSPAEMKAFIEKETPPGGYLWNVTPEEIFVYSQQHYLELLPKSVDAASQGELDSLRHNLRAQALSSPHP